MFTLADSKYDSTPQRLRRLLVVEPAAEYAADVTLLPNSHGSKFAESLRATPSTLIASAKLPVLLLHRILELSRLQCHTSFHSRLGREISTMYPPSPPQTALQVTKLTDPGSSKIYRQKKHRPLFEHPTPSEYAISTTSHTANTVNEPSNRSQDG